MSTRQTLLHISVIGMTLVITSCQSMEGSWKKAEAKATLSAYEKFELDYPDSPYSKTAKSRIDDLRYAEVQKEGTIEAYERFIASYPRSRHIDESHDNLRRLLFDTLSSSSDLTKFKAFLKKYPSGELADKAKQLSRRLFWEEVNSNDSIPFYEAFIKDYPDGPDSEKARLRLCELYFEQAESAGTINGYVLFLEKYKNGDLIEIARSLTRPVLLKLIQSQDNIKGYEVFLCWFPQDSEAEWAKTQLGQLRALEEMQTRNKELAEAVHGMSTTYLIPLKGGGYASSVTSFGDVDGHLRIVPVKPRNYAQKLGLVRKLLEQGADPSAMNIVGFEKAKLTKLSVGAFVIPSKKGEIADASSGGISLVEFARQNEIDDLVALFQKYTERSNK